MMDNLLQTIIKLFLVASFCILLILGCKTLSADEAQNHAQCNYVAGAMSAIQRDRIDSGYDVEDFVLYVRLMYEEGEGTDIIVSMVYALYEAVPNTSITPEQVFESAFEHCMSTKVIEGSELEYEL